MTGSHPSLRVDVRTALTDILHKYSHVFPALGDPVTSRTEMVHPEIETNGTRLIRCGLRHFTPAGLRTEQECVRDMLQGG